LHLATVELLLKNGMLNGTSSEWASLSSTGDVILFWGQQLNVSTTKTMTGLENDYSVKILCLCDTL
jgi:hypothetical protein